MRKHSVRKFIHAILNLLPLMVIPIFAIYSQNHEINGNTLQVQENKVVDFNQLYNYEITNNATNNNVEMTNLNNGYLTFVGDYTSSPLFSIVPSQNAFDVTPNHKFYMKGITNNYGWAVQIKSNIPAEDSYSKWLLQDSIFEYPLSNMRFNFRNYNGPANNTIDFNTAFQIYDLTQMFGSGNEPTIEQFNTYFTNTYYPYTESQEMVIENYETITYNDTDIMSQFMYVTYNACDKYFNMNNVFNLHGIWNWVSNTLFGGQPPISAFIVYNVIAYEFIMDIIFLLYAVFMFILDFAENCLEKPFNKIRRS